MADWYLKRNEQITGPYSDQELEDLLTTGKITKTDLIRQGTDRQFQTADSLPEQFSRPHENASYPKTSRRRFDPVNLVLILLIAVAIPIPLLDMQFFRTSGRRRSVTKNHLKQIGLALHIYHEQNTTFPPGALSDCKEHPFQSWQALILPYLDHESVFKQIDFQKSWDAPENRPPFQEEISVYLSPNTSQTRSREGYALSHFAGNKLVLKQNQGMKIRESITDGSSNTIMAVELGEGFKPWGAPSSLTVPSTVIGPGQKSLSRGGNHVLFCDGRVMFVDRNIDPAILKALSTPDGGETIIDY